MSPEQRSQLRAAIDTRQRELCGKTLAKLNAPAFVPLCAANTINAFSCKHRAARGSAYCRKHEPSAPH